MVPSPVVCNRYKTANHPLSSLSVQRILLCSLKQNRELSFMDTISIRPLSRVPIDNISSSGVVFLNCNYFSFFKFNRFKRCSSSVICVSHQYPSDHQGPKNRWNRSIPVNPFWAMVPIFQSIKDFAVSGTRTGSSVFRNSVKKLVSRSKGFSELEGNLEGWDGDYLQSGGIGMALLSVTSSAKVRISPVVATLAANPTFMSGLLAWFMAQSIKMFLNFFVERKWDFRLLFASGGMPSSHSALCTALTTSVALCHGVADSLFPVCLGFSLIVMYDAIGVRRHAGMQAEVLNMIVEDLFQGHPISERKLKELLGHTPSQVVAGALLGIIVACICCQGCLVAT